jgi:glyoxylase-like metal-dependent hydrolase (beta-lactamase superfamily II)
VNITKIDDNIYFLKGSRSSNIFFLDFEKKAIIDSGHPDEILQNINLFREDGISLEKIDLIFNTHSHGDHVGGNAYLKKINPDLKIACSKYKEEYQNIRKSAGFLRNIEDDFEEFTADIMLSDGDRVDLGGATIEVMETKGHSRDSLCFFLRDKKILFSGDTVYQKIITQVDYYQELEKSVDELMTTYGKIKSLDPDVIYTGHGDPIVSPAENTDYCIKKLGRFMKNNEMVVINNFIPMLEFFIYKNYGCDKSSLKKEIVDNFNSFKFSPFFNNFLKDNYESIFEKMYALMKLLDYFYEKDGKIYLKRKLNGYLDQVL